MIKKVKNIDSIEHIWCGMSIAPSGIYQLYDEEIPRWQTDDTIETAILEGDALVGNDNEFFTGLTALEYLRAYPTSIFVNQITAMEDTTLQLYGADGSGIDVTENGNVGFGNTAPTEKIDVEGNVKFDGNLLPDGLAGAVGQVLTSGGTSVSPTWQTPKSQDIGAIIFGFNGNAVTNRWLEGNHAIPSNKVPIVIATLAEISGISIMTETNSTCIVTVYKNGNSIGSISLNNSRKNYTNALTQSASAGDELSVQVTSGSCKRPILGVFIRGV